MLLDIALGVLGAIVFGRTQGVPLTTALVAIHILFALLPDTDFLLQIFQRKSFAHADASHRHLLHNPLIYIPLGFAVVAQFSLPLAWSFALLSALHFLHDSIGIGWGVRWLYPFSKRSYKFFSNHDGGISWNPVTSWNQQEEQQLEVRHNPDQDWFKRVYLRPHPIAIVEHVLTLGIAAIIVWLLI